MMYLLVLVLSGKLSYDLARNSLLAGRGTWEYAFDIIALVALAMMASQWAVHL